MPRRLAVVAQQNRVPNGHDRLFPPEMDEEAMNSLHDMSRAVGAIEGQIELMQAAQERQSRHNETIFDMLREIKVKIERIEERALRHDKVADMVAKHDTLIQKGAGAVVVLTLVAGAVGSLLGAFWKAIAKAMTGS